MSNDRIVFGVLAVLFGAMLVVALLESRAAYRNGVRDGYRAAKHPRDPIFESSGVNSILREAGTIAPSGRE